MAEIKLSDGSVVKTESTYDKLQAALLPVQERFLVIVDLNGSAHFVNRDHTIYARDDSSDS